MATLNDFLTTGNELFGRSDFVAALAQYDAALDLKEDVAVFHCNRAACLRQLNRLDEALTALERSLDLDPQLADAHFNKAIILQTQHRVDEAISSYKQCIAVNNSNSVAWRCLANCCNVAEKYEDALHAAESAIALSKTDVSAAVEKAVAQLQLGQIDEAYSTYTAISDAVRAGQDSRARQVFSAVCNANGLQQMEQSPESAINYFVEACDLSESETNLFNLAICNVHCDRMAEAITALQRVTSKNPEHVAAYSALGTILVQDSQWAAARSALQTAVTLADEAGACDDSLFQNLGVAHLKCNELDEAEACFNKALSVNPESDNAQQALKAVKTQRAINKANEKLGRPINAVGASGSASVNDGIQPVPHAKSQANTLPNGRHRRISVETVGKVSQMARLWADRARASRS